MKNNNTAIKEKDRYGLGMVLGVVCALGALALLAGYAYTFFDTLEDVYNALLNTVRVIVWVAFAAFTLASGIKGKALVNSKGILWALIAACGLRILVSLLFLISARSDFYALTASHSGLDTLHQLSACILYAALGICAYCISRGILNTAKWAAVLTVVMIPANMMCYCFAYIDALSAYYSYITDVLTYTLPAALGNSFVEIAGGISLLVYCIKYDKKEYFQDKHKNTKK